MTSHGFIGDSHANTYAKPYLVHGGRINMLAVGGNVANADQGALYEDYWFPWFALSVPRSVRVQGYYLDNQEHLYPGVH